MTGAAEVKDQKQDEKQEQQDNPCMKAGTFVLQTKPGDTVEYQSYKDDYICVHHHKNGSGTVYIIPRLQQKPIQCYTDSDHGNVYMIRSKQNNQTIRRCIWDPGSPFHIDCDRTRLHNVEMIPHARKNNANVGGVGGKAQIEGIGSWSPGQGEVRLIPTMRTALFSSQQYIDTHDGHFTQTRQHILYRSCSCCKLARKHTSTIRCGKNHIIVSQV